MNPSPLAERVKDQARPPSLILFTDRTDCVCLSLGCFSHRIILPSSARNIPWACNRRSPSFDTVPARFRAPTGRKGLEF